MNKYALAMGIFFMFFTASEIKADNFYPRGRVEECQLASVAALQYRDLPSQLDYNAADLEGETAGWIQNHTIHDVANVYYPDARRRVGVADRVAVPPGTTVDMGIMFWNYSGHVVHTNRLALFLSHQNPGDGDLTRLGAQGQQHGFTFNDYRSNRSGKYRNVDFNRQINNRVAGNGEVFYSFQTIQPLELVAKNVEASLGSAGLTLNYSYQLQNNSDYNICGLRIQEDLPNGATHEHSFCLNSRDNYNYQFQVVLTDFGREISIPATTFSDPNRYVESAAPAMRGTGDIYNFNTRNIIVSRNDSNVGHNWYGWQPSWGQYQRSPMQVEIIPYSFQSAELTIEVEPELEVTKVLLAENSIPDNIEVGENLELIYRLAVKNLGPTLENAWLVDLLPDELAADNDELSIELPELLFGEEYETDISTTFIASRSGELVVNNIAHVLDSEDGDVIAEDNYERTITVDELAPPAESSDNSEGSNETIPSTTDRLANTGLSSKEKALLRFIAILLDNKLQLVYE